MPRPLSPEAKEKSKRVFDILASLLSVPAEDQQKDPPRDQQNALSLALEECTELELKFMATRLGHQGYQLFLNALKTNTTLKYLSLDFPSSSVTLAQLADTLMHNKTLTQIRFDTVVLNEQTILILKKAIDSVTEGPIRPLDLIYVPSEYKNQFQRDLLNQRNRIYERAYRTGIALEPHLPKAVCDIVADYLGFKGEHFTAGLEKKPEPQPSIRVPALEPPSTSDAYVLCGIAGMYGGILLLMMGGIMNLFPLVILGFVGMMAGFIGLGLNRFAQARYEKELTCDSPLNRKVAQMIETENQSKSKPERPSPPAVASTLVPTIPLIPILPMNTTDTSQQKALSERKGI